MISKTIIDRDGQKLGKIIRIDDIMIKKLEETKPFAVILIKHLVFRNRIFPMPIDSPTQFNVTENIVQLTITKKEFTKLFKLYQTERKIKAKSAKLMEVSDNDAAVASTLWARW